MMMTETEIERLERLARDAKNARDALTKAVEAMAAQAAADVRNKYSDELRRLGKEAEDAIRLAQNAISAAASHPHEGKRVFKMVLAGRSNIWTQEPPMKRVDGIIEVRRADTHFPANLGSYSKPRLGATFVRALKKDGTPSLKVLDYGRYGDSDIMDDWQLADQPNSGE